jgi:hypothetical protein
MNEMKEKNLLYLASGPYIPSYKDLPINNLYLVDRTAFNFNYSQNNSENRHRKFSFQSRGFFAGKCNNVYEIGRDAFPAIDYLKENKVKIDILVSINEGLYEGGGTYPIFSDHLMGYLSPVLKDEILLICNLSYYSIEFIKQMKLDWGFNKIAKVLPDEPDYIAPALFTSYIRKEDYHQFGNVFRMKRNFQEKELLFKNLPDTKIRVKMGSIWDDADRLDMLGISLFNNFSLYDRILKYQGIKDFIVSKPKVFDLYCKNMDEIIDFAAQNNLKNIGLCPWMNGSYGQVIDFLQNIKSSDLDSITFYHLNRGDYKQLYNLNL